MKYAVLLLAFIVGLSSCSIPYMGRLPAQRTPFVQLKDGSVINAKEVGKEENFGDYRVVADTFGFERGDVAYYGNGDQIFANIGGGFWPKVVEGKINVYSSTNVAHYGYPYDANGFNLYLQDSGANDFKRLKYRNLKHMIPANTQAGTVLHRYATTRRTFALTMLGGFACFVAGTAISGTAVIKDQGDSKVNAGMSIIGLGAGMMATSWFALPLNKNKLKRAIGIHNGEPVD
jgi:hypothetical protein